MAGEAAGIYLTDLLDNIVAQLVTKTALDPSLVFLTDDENSEPAVKKSVQMLTVVPTVFRPDVGQQTGGSAYEATLDFVWQGIVIVNIWSVFMVDQVGQTKQWLEDANRGVMPLFRKVFAALEQYNPQDGAGANMLEQPMRISPGGFSFVAGRADNLRRIRTEWEVSFIQKMT